MKIISWNINGITGTFTEGRLDEVINQNPDILCIQEIKTSVIPKIRGYKTYANPSSSDGNYGTAIYTKIEPISFEKGFGDKEFDAEGRVIRMEFENFYLFNVYAPTGTKTTERTQKESFKRKCDFYAKFTDYINKSDKPSIICGDFNRISQEIDAKYPEKIRNKSGFKPVEQKWFKDILTKYVDAFRKFHKKGGKYTWFWNKEHRNLNRGYRFDYFLVSNDLEDSLIDSDILSGQCGSDHVPIVLDLNCCTECGHLNSHANERCDKCGQKLTKDFDVKEANEKICIPKDKIILLDLNYTLVSNSAKSRGGYPNRIYTQKYEEDLINLIKDNYVILITARRERFKDETLAHIKELTGFIPDETYWNWDDSIPPKLKPPEIKEHWMKTEVLPKHGKDMDKYLAIESNKDTRKMYNELDIEARPKQHFIKTESEKMNKVYLSKTKYCQCVQCEKILWLRKYKPYCAVAEDKTTIFENGRKVGELAKGLFGEYEDVPFDRTLSPMIERTQELLLNKPNVITEASFSYDNNFCSVDILKNCEDGVEIYEVKSTTSLYEDEKCTRRKDVYLDDVSYQYYVLSNLGFKVKKVCLIYINNEYVKGKLPVEDELDKYFKIKDVTDLALARQYDVKCNIDRINRYMAEHDENNEPGKRLGGYCFKPYDCEFWQYCSRNLPKPNVFDVADMRKSQKVKKYNEGKISFEDLENEELNPKYHQQIDFELHDRDPEINKEAIAKLLDSLKYPLYFIDYESYQLPIPEFEQTKPYQQLPFQYSLHIIREKGAPLEHKEFLAEPDDEDFIRHFAESMVNDLSEDGSVIVYNKVFEESHVNKKLAKMYPDLKDEIERINGNIVDFMVPFKNRDYYMKEMEGSYSIKYVLPALYPNDPKLNYDNLPIVHNGGEASEAFLSLKDKSLESMHDDIREGLLIYCKLDTYAMVKIWEKFKEVTQ